MQALQSTQMQLQRWSQTPAARPRPQAHARAALQRAVPSSSIRRRRWRRRAAGQSATDPSALPTRRARAAARRGARPASTQLRAAAEAGAPGHPRARSASSRDLEKQADGRGRRHGGDVGAPAGARRSPRKRARRERAARSRRAEIDSLGRQIAFKEGEERRLRALIADYQARIEAVPGLESEWTALDRDYATLQESYKNLLTKSEEVEGRGQPGAQQIGEQFRVLDRPSVSDQADRARTGCRSTSRRPGARASSSASRIVACKSSCDTSFRTRSRRRSTRWRCRCWRRCRTRRRRPTWPRAPTAARCCRRGGRRCWSAARRVFWFCSCGSYLA